MIKSINLIFEIKSDWATNRRFLANINHLKINRWDTSRNSLLWSVLGDVSGSAVQSSESLQQKSFLVGVSESQALDGLGSSSGASLDNLSGVVESCGGILVGSVGLMVRLVSNSQHVFSSEALLGLWFSLVGSKANSGVVGKSLSWGIMETGEVQWVAWPGFSSGSGSLWLMSESTVCSGQCPQNATWLFHCTKRVSMEGHNTYYTLS